MYADVIIDISHEKVDRPFQYLVPEHLKDSVEEGVCVTVPFGSGNRLLKGYVVKLGEHCEFDPAKIKPIRSVSAESTGVEAQMIRLAAWIRKNYGSTMIQALKTVLPARKTVKKLEHKTVECIASREVLLDALGEAMRKKQTARERLLSELLENEAIPYEWVTGKLGVSGSSIHYLVKAGIVRVTVNESYRNPVKFSVTNKSIVELSSEQRFIAEEILKDFDKGEPGKYLILGITGSGKTEVYLELAQQMIERGRQVIVLIPEIALTYQTLLRFYRRFGERVSVINSTLSPGEKYDQCERARKGEIDVIIGPRSALFTPFPDLGLIIMDEEHEASYKSESTPKYHARETAMELARIHGASVVLGSATPSLESYYKVETGEYRLFTLNRRLTGGTLAQVHVADLREELRKGNRSVFSEILTKLLEDRLQKKEQTMLFLNRRGYAGFISCRACGQVIKCPHCDVSLSEHKDGTMVCHYCGFRQPRVKVCPVCGSGYVLGFRAGTQQIEEKLKEMYPDIRILRMDADTTRTKESYEKILSAFANQEADILIGTQMIVKGHDFPNVTLVGVLAADLSLAVGDYRAGERTFQLLTQAAGRAGRGNKPSDVVIQTYQPEHYAIVHAANQDYGAFYEEEILYRKMLGYPPVSHMLAVQVYSPFQESGAELAQHLARKASGFIDETEEISRRMMVLGPTPAAIGKMNDIFRFVIYIKYRNYDTLIQIKDILEEEMKNCQGRENVQFDFDPMNTL